MPGRTQIVDQRLHTFNWISLAAGHGFLRALAERISLQHSASPFCPVGAVAWMVLGTDQHQHRHSAKEVRSPNWLPSLTVHHVCVGLPRKSVHTLGSRLLAPETPSGWCVGIVGTAPPGTEEVSQPSAARHVTPSTATGHCLSSTGAVKQFRQVFPTWNYGAEHLGQV